MNHLIWRLSGPSLFMGRLADHARRGVSVVISAQHSPRIEIAGRLCEALRLEFLSTDRLPPIRPPNQAVGEALGCESACPSLDSICDACHGVRCLVVEIVDSEQATLWSQFLGRLQHRARQNAASCRPVIFLIHRCPWPSQLQSDDVTITSLSWDDALSRADLVSFSHALLIGKKLPGIVRQVLVHTLAEISLTDLDLMQSISSEGAEEIASPFNSLRVWADGLGLNAASGPPPHIFIEGQTMEHSAWLACKGDQTTLRRRIWSAQARVLLPWVEEQRTKFLAQLAAWLPSEHDGQLMDDLELGTLDFLLTPTSAPQRLKRTIYTLRRTRNELAHCRSLAYLNLLDLCRLESA